MFCGMMATNIRDLRRTRGMTQKQLADMVGVSKSYLSELETGKKPINSLRLAAFAKALDVSPASLIAEIDDPDALDDLIEKILNLDSARLANVIDYVDFQASQSAVAGKNEAAE